MAYTIPPRFLYNDSYTSYRILFDIYVLREIQTLAPNTGVTRYCSTSTCCERFKHWLPTQACAPILFDICVLRETQALAPNTSVDPDLFRHLCVARVSIIPTQASTPDLVQFDIYVLREVQTLASNTSVYPDLVRHLCVARDSHIGSEHKRLPRSCLTFMCFERFKHWLPTQACAPILFDIYVLREIQTLARFTLRDRSLVRSPFQPGRTRMPR